MMPITVPAQISIAVQNTLSEIFSIIHTLEQFKDYYGYEVVLTGGIEPYRFSIGCRLFIRKLIKIQATFSIPHEQSPDCSPSAVKNRQLAVFFVLTGGIEPPTLGL